MRKSHVYLTLSILGILGVSTIFFNSTTITSNATSNLIDPAVFCQSPENIDAGIGKIFQIKNKILTIQSYNHNGSTGVLSCTNKRLIEPEPLEIHFECQNGELKIPGGWWRIRDGCRDFHSKQIKCNKFSDDFMQDVTQINLTRFKGSNQVYGFDLSENKSFQSTNNDSQTILGLTEISSSLLDILTQTNQKPSLPITQNSLAMSAAVCSIVNNGTIDLDDFCLKQPNDYSCYGKFDHDFVDFPNSYFATHEGDWNSSIPGYYGQNIFPNFDSELWNHFDFTNYSGGGLLQFSIGVRFNPNINIHNFNQLSTLTLNSSAPNNKLNFPEISSNDYGVISSYYNLAALNEIQKIRESQSRGVAQYYYDHLITTFRGYGALQEQPGTKNKGVFDPNSTHQFQRFCENGCRHLILTSHDFCDENFSSSVPADTEVHCFPKHLNINVNKVLLSSYGLFSIKGYDSVKILDLIIKVTSNNKKAEIKGVIKSGENFNINDYLGYIIPSNSHVIKSDSITSLSGYSAVDRNNLDLKQPGLISFNPFFYNYQLDSYNDALLVIAPWIAKERIFDFSQLFQISVFLSNRINEVKPKPIGCYDEGLVKIKDNLDFSHCRLTKKSYDAKMRCQLGHFRRECNNRNMFSSYIGNIIGESDNINLLENFQYPKIIFDVQENDKLLVSNLLLKSTAAEGISSRARKNIFHGNNFQGISLGELEQSGIPISNRIIGVDLASYNNSNINDMYFSPIFVAVSNPGGHIRFDNGRRAKDESISYENQIPQLYNLCKSLNGNEVNSSLCNSMYNFRNVNQNTFNGEEFFSPFYFSEITPENNARNNGVSFNHYSNDVYLKNFNPSLTPSFLTAFDGNPNKPVLHNVQDNNDQNIKTSSINNQVQCSSHIACGEDAYCYIDEKYPNGLCLNGNIQRHYLIASNNTFANHSFSTINFNNGVDQNLNLEFIQTDGINALIFNNILKNHQSDLYDLNFRSTHYRSEWNKSLIQVIERNVFANARMAKITGEGNPESKMRLSNNIYHNVRFGGYHGFFKPFYLNNTHIISEWDKVFDDQQVGFLNMEYLKPYGVRNTLFNNLFIKKRSIDWHNFLMMGQNTRPKQYAFDYNFSQNLYFAYFDTWFRGISNNSTDDKLNWNQFENLPTIGKNYNLNDQSKGCFGAYLFGGGQGEVLPNQDDTCPDFNPSLDDFQNFYGSYENMKFVSGDNDIENFGKIKLLTAQGDQSGMKLVAHRANLVDMQNPDSDLQSKYRINFIVEDCYGLQNRSIVAQVEPINFSQVNPDYLGSYSCVTGDNKSLIFSAENYLTEAENITDELDDSVNRKGNVDYLNDLKRLVSDHDSCGEIITTANNHKTPTVFVDSLGLSVLRDFEGKYRGVRSTSGAFDTNCD